MKIKSLIGGFSLFSLSFLNANCVAELKPALAAHPLPRTSPRDVRLVHVDNAWDAHYDSDTFYKSVTRILHFTPESHKRGVVAVLNALDRYAKDGRLKNLNEWIEGIDLYGDHMILPYICEAEYALLLVKQHSNYVVTFEPKRGFYKARDEDIPKGMEQKSIDLRISDRTTGRPIALREIKSIAGRANPYDNIKDAYKKVRLLPRLKVPELMEETPVEIGLVLFFDYDMRAEFADPVRMFSVPKLKVAVERYLTAIQEVDELPQKPFDTVTVFDFGSRRVIYVQRLADDSLVVTHYPLSDKTFEYFVPKVSIFQAKEIEDRSI